MVEALRLGDKMPFAHNGRLIAGLLKQFRESLLISVKRAGIVGEPVLVAELSGQYTGTRRSRQRVHCIAIVKTNSLSRYTVHIRSPDKIPSIARHGLRRMVICHNKNNVGTLRVFLLMRSAPH